MGVDVRVGGRRPDPAHRTFPLRRRETVCGFASIGVPSSRAVPRATRQGVQTSRRKFPAHRVVTRSATGFRHRSCAGELRSRFSVRLRAAFEQLVTATTTGIHVAT
jgi:hypothetical protein